MQRIGLVKDIFNEVYKLYNQGFFNKDKEYKVEITEFKGSKSDKQLALYNATLRSIQKIMINETGLTRDRLHNELLGEVGILELKNGEPIIVKINANYDYLSDNEIHLKSIGTYTDENGEEKRECYLLKESKNFTTDQFKQLIDALVDFILNNKLEHKIDVSHLQSLCNPTEEENGKTN